MKKIITTILIIFILQGFLLWAMSYRVEDYIGSGPNFIPDRNDKTVTYSRDYYYNFCGLFSSICEGDHKPWAQFVFWNQVIISKNEFFTHCSSLSVDPSLPIITHSFKLTRYCSED